MLIPAKGRFFRDDKEPVFPIKSDTKFRFNSYSFGVLKVKKGPEIIDELIDDIRGVNNNRTI